MEAITPIYQLTVSPTLGKKKKKLLGNILLACCL